jgi:hypothetical protein
MSKKIYIFGISGFLMIIAIVVAMLYLRKTRKTPQKKSHGKTPETKATHTTTSISVTESNPIDTVPCMYKDCFYLLE